MKKALIRLAVLVGAAAAVAKIRQRGSQVGRS